MAPNNTKAIQCHYDILGVDHDADAATIKKRHRRLVLQYHPDKNLDDPTTAETHFRLVQQAYECLSDPAERKWYDEHRDAILAGWTANGGGGPGKGDMDMDMIFDVAPYMHPSCYSGYDSDDKNGFYSVYTTVFTTIVQYESSSSDSDDWMNLPTDFGTARTVWSRVQHFYQKWGSFQSSLNFAWHDMYDARNSFDAAHDRRIRRLMEEDNKKARRKAKKIYHQDIFALVTFLKRRDPRVKAHEEELERQKEERIRQQKQQAIERKVQQQKAKEAWQEEVKQEMEAAEEADRLAGRVRLADLEDEDYDYGGSGKKKGRKGKKKKRNQQHQVDECIEVPEENQQIDVEDGSDENKSQSSKILETGEEQEGSTTSQDGTSNAAADLVDGVQALSVDDVDDILLAQEQEETMEEDDYTSESESEEEPDIWRCECCNKVFKSIGQMENHMKSKKHKAQFKKFQAKGGG